LLGRSKVVANTVWFNAMNKQVPKIVFEKEELSNEVIRVCSHRQIIPAIWVKN